MGNGYDQHSLHRRSRPDQKSIFLPMFCRLSLTDIINPHCRKNPISGDGEPSSPKVSCMGQVHRNNRVIGFPAAAPVAGAAHHHQHHRYSRLRKLFSGKTLLPPPTSSIPAAGGARFGGCRGSRCPKGLRRLKVKNDGDCGETVDVCELDPPLPVVRRAAPEGGCGGGEASLWRRRFTGAAALKALQIEQIRNQPPTVN
ncbi:hypothetical protein STAS_17018 [Striga asiatica]|uniref:Uncharacterized protein n=1 Tax=Striga asiatica TaxID=4170 RepID=A0A5A7Q5W8_STRAF|nr:hypothetical protein STAS_17018 [Striga asiatica]